MGVGWRCRAPAAGGDAAEAAPPPQDDCHLFGGGEQLGLRGAACCKLAATGEEQRLYKGTGEARWLFETPHWKNCERGTGEERRAVCAAGTGGVAGVAARGGQSGARRSGLAEKRGRQGLSEEGTTRAWAGQTGEGLRAACAGDTGS